MTFNKTAEVEAEATKYYCVQNTELGCLVGCKNLLTIGDKMVIS
jgi:hypothetical protein